MQAAARFNHKAQETNLAGKADSRGLRIKFGRVGVSPFVRQELGKRGVPEDVDQGNPRPLTADDLKKSDYVVIMDEKKHREMLTEHFPELDARRIHYWHVPDTDEMKAPAACKIMSKNVDQLLRELVTPPAN